MTYRFQGRIIKLTHQDFDLWKRRFHAIPDLEAALWSLDDFYAEHEVEKWFIRASRALQNQHQEWVVKREAEKPVDMSKFRRPSAEEARLYRSSRPYLTQDPEWIPIDWRPNLKVVK